MTPFEQWFQLPRPTSRWRIRARAAIRGAILHSFGDCPEHFNEDAVMVAVDAAYPFGPRSHHPYKAWLAERKLFKETVLTMPIEFAPTADDYAACEVATDLVEMGRDDEARQLLADQAKRRLARACPTCGVARDMQCREIVGDDVAIAPSRIVPHLARVAVDTPSVAPRIGRASRRKKQPSLVETLAEVRQELIAAGVPVDSAAILREIRADYDEDDTP